MGGCCSTTKLCRGLEAGLPTPSSVTARKQESSSNNHHKINESNQQRHSQQNVKSSSRRPSGVIPCGKRTDFGYDKDFDSRYTIGKLLGHGQFGYTYFAIDNSNGDRVAAKKIEKNKAVDLQTSLIMSDGSSIAVEDVKREVKILKALAGHENVVQFCNAFEDDSYVYIVMELCEGGELLDRILSKTLQSCLKQLELQSSNIGWLLSRLDLFYTPILFFVLYEMPIFLKHMHHSKAEPRFTLTERIAVTQRKMLQLLIFYLSPGGRGFTLKATDFGLSDIIRPGKKFQDIVGSAYYVAPEVLKRKSGPESDVWSIGVITYILLCGRRPFWDKTEDGIFKEVLRRKPDFLRKPWPGISNAAKDFVKKLLVKDPRARLTAAQALSHPWVREGGEASEIPLDISVLSNMRQFVKYSRFKQFALRALASTLDEEELADLRDQFDAIDVDKNGVISLEEMRQFLIDAVSKFLELFPICFFITCFFCNIGPGKGSSLEMKDSRVLEILQAIDSNTDGLVDFSEFVGATLHVHQLEMHSSEKWQQRSQAAFEKFDVDRNGFITPEELKW
ncbi:UNVERIFIED_CONTAM: Calcium-dependent protein kinase [Sesamum angustifolium]|uniref:Calcium-dependent protein kinase n=1 Tax=Sesamum angustifolium TaxID=2727405 RepID=A0AAW2RMQ0_9LAMI